MKIRIRNSIIASTKHTHYEKRNDTSLNRAIYFHCLFAPSISSTVNFSTFCSKFIQFLIIQLFKQFKTMKTVFKNIQELAHVFAYNSQTNGKSNSLFFSRGVVYSYGYHFPIAKHVTNDKGETGVLFTLRDYSVSTAKHKNAIHSAIGHLNIIYCHNPENSHANNLNYWQKEAQNIASNLITARKPEKYLLEISKITEQVQKYCEFFGLPIPLTLSAVLAISTKDEYIKFRENATKLQQEQERKEKEQAKKAFAKSLSKWRKFEISHIYNRVDFDYLRYNKQTDTIETTQGVKIPKQIGVKFYELLECGKIAIGDEILNFTVSKITPKTISIGCHCFKISELQSIYKSLCN